MLLPYSAFRFTLGIPQTKQSAFRREIPAGTFASSSFSTAFFRSKACFRFDQSACFPPGHEYYEVRRREGQQVMGVAW